MKMKMKHTPLILLSLTLGTTALAGPSEQSLMEKRLQQGQSSQAENTASVQGSNKSITQRGPKKLHLALNTTRGNKLAGSVETNNSKIQRHGPRHW